MVNPRRLERLAAAAACLAIALALTLPSGLPVAGVVLAQSASHAASSELEVEFQDVRAHAARLEKELPRFNRVLQEFAAELQAQSGGSPAPTILAKVDEARAVLRGHDEVLRRFAVYGGLVTQWRDASQEIEELAQLLNVEGDRVLSVIAERPARTDTGPDGLATAHNAYRQAMTELVYAAQRTRDRMRAVRDRERLAGESSGGRADPRFRKLVAQFGEGFGDAAVYLPSAPPELFRPRERPTDAALDVALIWDGGKEEWYRLPGNQPIEAFFRDAYIAYGRRPTPEQLNRLTTNYAQISLRQTKADIFTGFLAGAASDPALAKALAEVDGDGSMRRSLREPWLFRIRYTYDDAFHARTLGFLGRLRETLVADKLADAALTQLDRIAGRFNLTLGHSAEKTLPAVGTVRVVSWLSGKRSRKSVSVWRFDQERVAIETGDRQLLGLRKDNVVTSEAPTSRRNCRVKDTRTFAEDGTLTFTAVQTCERRGGRTRARDVSGAGTWELLHPSEKGSDPAE